jgi:hypothetical protein
MFPKPFALLATKFLKCASIPAANVPSDALDIFAELVHHSPTQTAKRCSFIALQEFLMIE